MSSGAVDTIGASEASRPHAIARILTLVLRILLNGGVAIIPMIVVFGAHDPWRLPKIAAFRGLVVVLIALTAVAALLVPRALTRPALRRTDVAVIGAIVLWTAVTFLTSTDRVHSMDAAITVICSAAFFVIATMVLRGQPIAVTLTTIAVPAIGNAIFVTLQALSIWNPVALTLSGIAPSDIRTGFLGNSNFVGTFLVTPALVLLAGALLLRGAGRWFCGAGFAAIAAGFVMSRTLTAFIAFLAATVVLAIVRWKKNAAVAGLAAALLVGVAFAGYAPLRNRIQALRTLASQNAWDALTTGRLTAFATAVEMARDRPLVGVGPGCFEVQYMAYNVRAMRRHPVLYESPNRGVNFGETHNEPLQYAAESGLPGALLFFVALGLLAWRAREGEPLPRTLALTFAVLLLVLSAAQFPFHLPSSLMMNLYVTAFCFSHGTRD